MKITLDIPWWVLLIPALIIAVLIFVNVRQSKQYRATVHALDSTSVAFETYRLKTDELVSRQTAIVLAQEDAIELGFVEQERLEKLNLKRIAGNVKLQEKITMLEKELAFVKEPVVVYRDTSYEERDVTLKYLEVPTSLSYSDKWMNFYATIDVPTSRIDTIGFLSVPEITLGWERQGFLKKQKRTIFYTNENPYVTVVDMQNVIIEKPKKWYQTDVAKITGGIVVFEALRMLLMTKK